MTSPHRSSFERDLFNSTNMRYSVLAYILTSLNASQILSFITV